jgi:hypothetical protein
MWETKPIVFQKIPLYEKIDTNENIKAGKKYITFKTDYYIVRNFTNKEKDSTAIFNFAKNYNRSKDFDEYTMYFYKESRVTNLKKIIWGPGEGNGEITYESDDNDMLYYFHWSGNRIIIRSIENGEEIYYKAKNKL